MFSCILQFFADGWRLPTKQRLTVLSPDMRRERDRQFRIIFFVLFIGALLLLALLWRTGSAP